VLNTDFVIRKFLEVLFLPPFEKLIIGRECFPSAMVVHVGGAFLQTVISLTKEHS